MTREILFRAKRKDGKGWVYGDLNQHDIHHGTAILENGVINNAVTPETVGQYTGLKDKNGVKIFEGDIVQTDGSMSFSNYDSERGSIREIYSGQTGFVGIRVGNIFDSDNPSSAHIWSNYQLWNIGRSLTIVGNIHDPELLNQTT